MKILITGVNSAEILLLIIPKLKLKNKQKTQKTKQAKRSVFDGFAIVGSANA